MTKMGSADIMGTKIIRTDSLLEWVENMVSWNYFINNHLNVYMLLVKVNEKRSVKYMVQLMHHSTFEDIFYTLCVILYITGIKYIKEAYSVCYRQIVNFKNVIKLLGKA